MYSFIAKISVAILVTMASGCDRQSESQLARPETRTPEQESKLPDVETEMKPLNAREVKTDPPNEAGFAITRFWEADTYREGIVDANGMEVLQASPHLLVKDLTGSLALINVDRKFLFVPLGDEMISKEDLDSVNGFQYAEPFHCGHALVVVNDRWFYIDSNFEKAFDMDFQFAESFHHDRALVNSEDRYRILDTAGKTVADLNFDQVTAQSPWCWLVTKIEQGQYRSGFVNLDGKLITEMIYDGPVYYQPDVQRIRVSVGKLHGFLNEHAKPVIPVQYEHAEIFDRGKARVSLNGRSFFINPDGVEVPE